MREIKFRAWSKKYNEMWGVANLSWVIDKKYDEPERDIASIIQTVGAINEGKTVSKVGNNSAKDLILMQYTGLKDKNGVEIYEGDIVKYQLGRYKDPDGGYGSDNWEMFDEVAEVVYDEAKGRFKRKDRFHDFLDTPECEVIGNIYENPELLGNKNV